MSKRILILGAGGHGQVVADIIVSRADAGVCVAGYLDDDVRLHGKSFLGFEVLGGRERLEDTSYDAVVLAVGDNMMRMRLCEEMQARGVALYTAVHSQAIVAASARLGDGCMVAAGVVVNPGARVGMNVILNTGCTVDHHNVIGNHSHIAPGVHLGGDVVIGDGVLVGIGATVMPGLSVGEWSVVGAGACVVHAVPNRKTVVGVPARPAGQAPCPG